MRRAIRILDTNGKDLAQADILRRIWCRSMREPRLVACATQRRDLLEGQADGTWRIDALRPVGYDESGIPSIFQLHHALKHDKLLTPVFTYRAMMDRMEFNYGPMLVDPLKRVCDHYEDERRHRVRGTGLAGRPVPADGSSQSSEAWARYATLR